MPCPGIKGRLNGHDLHQVKAEFIRLYLEERRELKNIVRIFKDRGLDASIQHWKTQMREWDIGKYNRESDMRFAAQKAKFRKDTLGKDTMFKIKGSEKSVQDIKRCLRRRRQQRLNDEGFVFDNPRTPEGIMYFTPLTSPLLAQLQTIPNSCCDETIAAKDVSNQNMLVLYSTTKGRADTSHGADLNDQSINDQLVYDPTGFRLRSFSLPPTPKSPDIFYAVEIALSAIKDYYGSILAAGRAESLSQDGGFIDHLHSLKKGLSQFHHHFTLGNSYSVQASWEDMCRSVPKAVTFTNTEPLALTDLMGLAISLQGASHNLGSKFGRMVSRASSTVPERDNPVGKVFETLSLADEPVIISEILLRQAKDYLCGYLPGGHRLRLHITYTLCYIYTFQNDWNTVLDHAATLNSSIGSCSTADIDIQTLNLISIRICFVAYLELKKFEDALQMLEAYLFSALKSSYAPNVYHTHYLAMRGEFHRRTGNIQGAITDLRTAWEWASQHLRIENSATIERVAHMYDAEHGRPFWPLV